MNPSFKPSEVLLIVPPLVGTMRKAEAEFAAALIVYVCTTKGDTWQPITFAEIQTAVQLARASVNRSPREKWLHETFSNPFMPTPDVHRLMADGFAEKVSADGEPILVQLLPKAFDAIGQRWVQRPPVGCARCRAPIAKFIQQQAVWHPCHGCDGSLCEKCCDAMKAADAASPTLHSCTQCGKSHGNRVDACPKWVQL